MAVAARTMAAAILSSALLCSPAAAQTAGDAVFHVYVRGNDIGTLTSSLVREENGGWQITGTGALGEPIGITLRQLEMHFDANWNPLRMTMEQAQGDDSAVVHVAFGLADGETRTDVVRPGQAVWGSNKVAPDTIPLPDYVFAAYEVLAARLQNAAAGTEFRAFVVPRFEGLVHVDLIDDQTFRMAQGTVPVKRYKLTMHRPEGNTPVHVWVYNGRAYRLDFPGEEIAVIREDVLERR